jgi:Bacterial membrane protein YfhO
MPIPDSTPNTNNAAASTRRQFYLPIVALLLLTLCMFGDVLFSSDTVLSKNGLDLVQQGIPWREFGFGELRKGNLPLWNPHVFLGVPFLGGFQSALLYPPNWLYLVLPVGLTTNWLIAGHLFLGGLFMYLWAWRRGLHTVACLMAAALLMFCGPQFLRVPAGHLPPLLAMAWVPLLFWAIDEFFTTRRQVWCLVGMGAMAMEILAGHPQYCFCTVVAASIYSCLCLIHARNKLFITLGLASMLLGASALAAAQLLPGLATASESIRKTSLPYIIASSFSLPPENLLTLAVPGVFGDDVHVEYWGRWNMPESSLFMGATGVVLALYGSIYGERATRRFSLTMVIVLLLISLGDNTPLFHFLYDMVPGFDKFRSVARFDYLAALFLSMLAGIGLDRLIRQPRQEYRSATVVATVAVVLGIAAVVVYSAVAGPTPASWWGSLLKSLAETGQISIARAGTFLGLAALFVFLRARSWVVYGIAMLAVAEVFAFARMSRDTFSLSQAFSHEVDDFLAEHRGDYRVFNALNHNQAMMQSAYDLWGYDSLIPMRLAELMAYSQGQKPTNAVFYAHYPSFNSYHRFFELLRLRYIFQKVGDDLKVHECPIPLPRLKLVQGYRVRKQRDAILAAMNDTVFDAKTTVILEDDPDVKPDADATPGTATVVDESTDYLVIEAHLAAPGILLITDGWSKNWRALPLPDSVQHRYRVMPADYVLRAIPLEAGDHMIRLEYRSIPFVIGKWISLVALVAYGFTIAAQTPYGSTVVRRIDPRRGEPKRVDHRV